MKRSLREWDLFQLKLARHYSTMSRDPSTKVGAVVTDQYSKRVFGLGYNGFPENIEDTEERLNDRDFKYAWTVHAEQNALDQVSLKWDHREESFEPSLTLFVYPFISCAICAEQIVGWYGGLNVKRLVTLDYVPERWKESFESSEQTLLINGIEVVKYKPSELGETFT